MLTEDVGDSYHLFKETRGALPIIRKLAGNEKCDLHLITCVHVAQTRTSLNCPEDLLSGGLDLWTSR